MQTISKIGTSVIFLFLFIFTQAQESVQAVKTSAIQSSQTTPQKARNNNTVRSNRTEIKISDVPTNQNYNPNAAASRKGYDYYKAQSDVNVPGVQNKAQDHNSSRSNKSSNIAIPDNQGNGDDSGKKEISNNDKTDKSEAVRTKKK